MRRAAKHNCTQMNQRTQGDAQVHAQKHTAKKTNNLDRPINKTCVTNDIPKKMALWMIMAHKGTHTHTMHSKETARHHKLGNAKERGERHNRHIETKTHT